MEEASAPVEHRQSRLSLGLAAPCVTVPRQGLTASERHRAGGRPRRRLRSASRRAFSRRVSVWPAWRGYRAWLLARCDMSQVGGKRGGPGLDASPKPDEGSAAWGACQVCTFPEIPWVQGPEDWDSGPPLPSAGVDGHCPSAAGTVPKVCSRLQGMCAEARLLGTYCFLASQGREQCHHLVPSSSTLSLNGQILQVPFCGG